MQIFNIFYAVFLKYSVFIQFFAVLGYFFDLLITIDLLKLFHSYYNYKLQQTASLNIQTITA